MTSIWTSNIFPKMPGTLKEKTRVIFYMNTFETVSFPGCIEKSCFFCSEMGRLRIENAMLKKRLEKLEKIVLK
jgi:hypothetical protein